MGGLCPETGAYWRYEIPREVRSRTVTGKVEDRGSVSLEVLRIELLATLVTAHIAVEVERVRAAFAGGGGGQVTVRGDKRALMHRMMNCDEGRRGRRQGGGVSRRYMHGKKTLEGFRFNRS